MRASCTLSSVPGCSPTLPYSWASALQLVGSFTLPQLDCGAGLTVALDSADGVYVYERAQGRILKLSSGGVAVSLYSGSSSDLTGGSSIAVDGAGTVHAGVWFTNEMVKISSAAFGSNTASFAYSTTAWMLVVPLLGTVAIGLLT